MKKTKIGVLGCSNIAKKSFIPAIKKSQNFVLSGVASRSIVKANDFSCQFQTEPHTYESLLKSDAEVVYVSLPVGLHYKWGKRVLESGKHLLMEKTFTETKEQAKDLFNLATVNNLGCMEALMYEFHPVQERIASLSKKIGKIRSVEAHFAIPHFSDRANIRYSKNIGGGAALDCLIYPLSFVFKMLGKDYVNSSISKYIDAPSGVDERGYIHLKYKEAVANISYGYGHSYRNEILVWGETGILKAQRVFSRPECCILPIEIWSNGVCKKYKVNESNHFVNMLDSYFDIEHWRLGESTMQRISFIEKVLKENTL